MICSRYLENKDFTPQTYYQIRVTAAKDDMPFSALSEHKYEPLPAVNTALSAVTATGTVTVADVQCKEVSQDPPLLYDLTSLQKEANSKLGFSADKTLNIAQSLYEAKVLSYPAQAPVISPTMFSTKSPPASPFWNNTRHLPPMPPP